MMGDDKGENHPKRVCFLPILCFAAYRLRQFAAPPQRGVVGSRRHIRSPSRLSFHIWKFGNLTERKGEQGTYHTAMCFCFIKKPFTPKKLVALCD